MKVVKIEIVENNGTNKPEKYVFPGPNAIEQAAKLFRTKFNISLVDFEEVKK